jgi:hypothetical protein
MKVKFMLLGSGLLAASLAVAQDMPATGNQANTADQNTQTTSQTHQTSNSAIRGCLSGSAGNYTLTDQNGTQYRVMGDEAGLQGKAGHEVEITTRQDQDSQTTSQGDRAAQQTTNTVQVPNVRDISTNCNTGNSPMNNSNGSSSDQNPQPMAMLQQQSTNAPEQTTPPVTSQTAANPGQSTSNAQQNTQAGTTTSSTTSSTTTTTTNQQNGNSPANNTGMTESEANHDAQAARQGELNTNSSSGDTAGRGVNNQGVNNPSTTNPNAVPNSPNSATPSSAQQPQANDQNKPLYERQATDIPWAKSSGNTGASNPSEQNPPH